MSQNASIEVVRSGDASSAQTRREWRSSCKVLILREQAAPIGVAIADGLQAKTICAYAEQESAREIFRRQFHDAAGWVLVMSVGIAVRFLDGLMRDKQTDPAVVVLDEGCHHAVALLSGHEGGANQLAFAVANLVGAAPVVSTATEAIKTLVLGIGCRRGVVVQQIADAVNLALNGRTIDEIRCVATIAAKRHEPGLLEFCLEHGLPLRVFEHEDVAARAWIGKPSEWVQATLGLDGVCEPCALMATPRGKLIVPKTTHNGVAVAIVEDAARLA